MDVDMPPSSAMEATKYSKYVSLLGIKALKLSLDDKKNNKTKCTECNCKNKKISKEEFMESICYACRHIIQDTVRFIYTKYNCDSR